MIALIIGILLLLCLVGFFIWWKCGEYCSFSGFLWLLIMVIIPFSLFIVGAFLTTFGILNLFGMGV